MSRVLPASVLVDAAGDAPVTGDTAREAALAWQVTLWSGEVTAGEHAAFARWRVADVAHERAWQEVEHVTRQLHAGPAEIAARVLRAGRDRPAQRASTRRHLLRGFGLAAGIGTLLHAARQTPQWQAAGADHSTERGERRDLTLADGTRLTLNTASAIDLRFTATERRIVLRAGEVLITTAPDIAPLHRPMIVDTGSGTLRALGTRFTVRDLQGASPAEVRVEVFDGVVEIAPNRARQTLRVAAGQRTRFNGTVAAAPESGDPTSAAWSRGLLVAERMRLADFLAELGRYRTGSLRCDPAVAELVVSGVYPLDDTDAVLRALAQALPVRVDVTTRLWVTVHAR